MCVPSSNWSILKRVFYAVASRGRSVGRTRLPVVSLLMLAISVACAAGRSPVVINGIEMPYEEGAEMVLREGQAALQRGDRATAEQRFKLLLDRFGDSDLVPYALDGLGKITFEDSGCATSAEYDYRLMENFPRHPGALRAQKRQAGCDVEGTVPQLSTRFTEMYEAAATDDERRDVATQAAEEAIGTGDYPRAVQWLLRLRTLVETDPVQREAVEADIVDLLDGKVSANDLQALASSLTGRDFPAAFVNAKLALLLEHAGDLDGARRTLERYIATWPTGEFESEARRRLERLSAAGRESPGTIGVLLPLSGQHRGYGNVALRSIRMGLGLGKGREITQSGLRVVIVDTKSDAATAANAVDTLVVEHGVQAILGPIFTYEAEPAAFRAQALGVPLLTISRGDNLAKIGPFIFQNAVTSDDQVKALVAHVTGVMGMKKFAVLYPRHPYGEELMQLFWDEVEATGGEVVGIEAYEASATTFTQQVKRLVGRDDLELRADFRQARDECAEQPDSYRKARCERDVAKNIEPLIDFDGLFVPHYPPKLSMISAALAAEDVIVEQNPNRLEIIEKTIGRKVKPVTLLGANGWNSQTVINRSGRNVENAVFTDGFFTASEDPVTAEFVAAYEQRYDRKPRLYPEAIFFDSARILSSVMSNRPVDRQAVRDALAGVADFPGVTGLTSFSGNNVASRPIQILTIKNGAIQRASLNDEPAPDSAPAGR